MSKKSHVSCQYDKGKNRDKEKPVRQMQVKKSHTCTLIKLVSRSQLI